MPDPSEVKKPPNLRKKRIKLKRNTGDYSKLPKSLISHLQRMWSRWFSQTTKKPSQPKAVKTEVQKISRFRLPKFISLTFLIISLVLVLFVAAVSVTQPSFLSGSQTPLSCSAKINGNWQTNWGSITFQEKPNLPTITGKYEYENLDRGKIAGNLTGDLSSDVLDFTWQETSDRGTELKGKGTFLFQNNCKDFFGSYGVGNRESGRGNWRGTIVKVLPLNK